MEFGKHKDRPHPASPSDEMPVSRGHCAYMELVAGRS